MMNQLLEVREFQYITCNPAYKNEGYHYLAPEPFEQLENFILAFNEGGETDAVDFLKLSVRKDVGKVIQAKNFVGLIQMQNGYQIQILPKITNSSEENEKKTFLRMLRSMKDFPCKVFNVANLKMDRMNLYEIFINMYIQEIRSLVKKGIRSAYLTHEDNQKYFKGKLIVSKHIRNNQVHKERFYVGYDDFSVNRAENRLIKSTLHKLQKLSGSAENIRGIQQLLNNFEMVTLSVNYSKDFQKVVIDRNTRSYETSMSWSKVFLMNQSFTTFAGSNTARALLFPMEKVFEAYVAKNLKKVCDDYDWEVSSQDKGYYLFDVPRQFALRPDLVITREDGKRVILDTKWKSLFDNSRKNYGISQGDMYQMYAYSKKYETSEIWLLYPANEEMVAGKIIRFESNDNVTVQLYFVDIVNIDESLIILKQLLFKAVYD